MKKILLLVCFHLGIWGILGFFATLILGFVACCTNMSQNLFFGILALFAIFSIVVTVFCVSNSCRKKTEI